MPSREVTSLTTADVLTRVEVKLFFKRSLNGKVITTYQLRFPPRCGEDGS